ncbi:esterase-like activity of phytase family protein [Aquabacterium sp.]|uniref:esterase-like activity of phytase family protein n=1 Tax=Aquabacterium sp. TaxID=1872578 RepID=UPI0035B376AF
MRLKQLSLVLSAAFAATSAHAGFDLLGIGSLSATAHDLSGQSGLLENGVAGDLLGGMGSGLAWAGGNTFLALPDRGPNAVTYNSAVDDTASYIARFQTVTLNVSSVPSGSLPYTVTPTLTSTTMLWSDTPLNYGAGGAPSINTTGKYYFTGRSDGFGAGNSLVGSNARLDPESIRMSNDGKSVFVSDEYGPYVYQFDRGTGQRTRTYTLPGNLGVSNVNAQGALEISGNTSGRLANKGMEGLAISPDGKTLVGVMQSPLIQDGGKNGTSVRLVTIDVETGATKQYAYKLDSTSNTISEVVFANDHTLWLDERDGKGLGDGSKAVTKKVFQVDLNNATNDVSGLSGDAALGAVAIAGKTQVLDVKKTLSAALGGDAMVPAKIEGMAVASMTIDGVATPVLVVANDNDFVATATPNGSTTAVANPNLFAVYRISGDTAAGIVTQRPCPSRLATR